jgi:ELWxxDGT repeat protein
LVVNDKLFFNFDDGTHGEEMWISDGTASGTVLLKDIIPGVGKSLPYGLTNVNNVLFFYARNSNDSYAIWKSDGTESGTVYVKGDFVLPGFLTSVDAALYFVADDGLNGNELWKSDGTGNGTVMVKDINHAPKQFPQALTAVNNNLFFVDNDGSSGNELWKSNGTEAGTVLVKDIHPGSAGSGAARLTNINGTLFFLADDGIQGPELWKSDGTETGTVLIKDINPGTSGSYPAFPNEHFIEMNGVAYFFADDGTHGFELWKSDGTELGTILVKDIVVGSGDAYVNDMINMNSELYFTVGFQLWKSDGTEAGTVLIKNINPGGNGTSISQLHSSNGLLFFAGDDGVHGHELWKSDGTASGTVMVKDINPGIGLQFTYNLSPSNGFIYFVANNGVDGFELWKSDGTEAGTIQVKDINPNGDSAPQRVFSTNDILFFTANDGEHGFELWKTDGTLSGTVMVKDINPGAQNSGPSWFNALNNTVYFTANDLEHGIELWKTDGSAAGTKMVKDINPGEFTSTPYFLTTVGNALFFTADDGVRGRELWKLDPNQSITFALLDDKVATELPFTLTATATSGLTIVFSIVSGPATIAGNTLTLTGSGLVTVRASQPGDESHDPAIKVDRSFTVTKDSQTIAFAIIPDKKSDDPPFTLSAKASSGLPVTLSIVLGPATVVDSTFSLNGSGSVLVRASQAGNEKVNAAPNVDRAFNVVLVLGILPLDETSIQAYPNPSSKTLMIRIPATVSCSSLSLVNDLGNTVWEQKDSRAGVSISLESLSKGLYLLRLDCNPKNSIQKIIVE